MKNKVTKAVEEWIDWLVKVSTYDGEIEESLLKTVHQLYKRCGNDPAKFAENYTKNEIKLNGYHSFANSGVGFLDEFRDEALKQVDWQYIGFYFCRQVGLIK